LKNECKTVKVAKEEEARCFEQKENRKRHEANLVEVEAVRTEKKGEEEKVEDGKKAFFDDLDKSEDLNDKLQSLIEFLQDHTKATGVYIGNL